MSNAFSQFPHPSSELWEAQGWRRKSDRTFTSISNSPLSSALSRAELRLADGSTNTCLSQIRSTGQLTGEHSKPQWTNKYSKQNQNCTNRLKARSNSHSTPNRRRIEWQQEVTWRAEERKRAGNVSRRDGGLALVALRSVSWSGIRSTFLGASSRRGRARRRQPNRREHQNRRIRSDLGTIHRFAYSSRFI